MALSLDTVNESDGWPAWLLELARREQVPLTPAELIRLWERQLRAAAERYGRGIMGY